MDDGQVVIVINCKLRPAAMLQAWSAQMTIDLDEIATAFRQMSRDALRQSGWRDDPALLDRLVSDMAASIRFHCEETAHRSTLRVAHDSLRRLFRLLDSPDPPVGQIRARVRNLPAPALSWLEQRANRLSSTRGGGKDRSVDFLKSVDDEGAATLVPKLRLLVSEGGQFVQGRSDDRQARMRFEPMIMGVTRGAANQPSRGGRPKRDSVDDLVMNLALDWIRATEEKPNLQRADKTGFPGLVHGVFQLLGIGGAEQALRRYGTEVRRSSDVA